MESPQPADVVQLDDVVMQDAHDQTEDAVGEDEAVEQAPSEENGDPVDESDSSEEGEDDPEDLMEVSKGFIDDEEEEEVDTDEDERRRRRRKKKKRKRVKDYEDGDLDEDDLDLIDENLGVRNRRLTRVRRGRASTSPPPDTTSRKRARSESGEESGAVGGLLNNIWNEDRDPAEADDIEDDDDFIEYDDDQEGEMNEEELHERRRAEKQRRRAMGARPEMAGIDPAAWDEIFDVFGDGRDYEWALEGEDGDEHEEIPKSDMKYQDVFEPSEIRARHLTEDDDIIRMTDIPERMQLSTSSLSSNATLALHEDFDLTEHLQPAAEWVALRISPRIVRDFFRPNAPQANLLQNLVMAVTHSLDFMLIRNYEVPYIHTHRRDIISYFDHEKTKGRTELLSRDELWRVQNLGMKFRALMERKQALLKTYERMGVHDEYFEEDMKDQLTSIEAIGDATEWLGLKHRQAQKDAVEMGGDDLDSRRLKKPTRTSAYEVARGTVTSKLADDFGISIHKVVLNFVSHNKEHFTLDQDINPLSHAEQFVGDSIGRTAEEQLATARMILATELGRDPLIRMDVRKKFEIHAVVTVTPTEKGANKIDEFHPYYNFKHLKEKPVSKMVESAQFLHILQAEQDRMVSVEIKMPDLDVQDLEERLYSAFSSDAYTDAGREWNQQRRETVKEAMVKFLLPAGAKWAREWLREEVEDMLAKKCGDALQERINQAPFKAPGIDLGEVPTVLAVSWGKGDPQKDAIHAVFLDETGRLREHLKMDNLVDGDLREAFLELIKRRRPDVIVVGGFTLHTKRLMETVKSVMGIEPPPEEGKQRRGPNGAHGSSSQSNAWSGNNSQSNDSGGWPAPPASGSGGGDWGQPPGATNDWSSAPAVGDNNPWGNTNTGNSSSQPPSGSLSKDKGKERERDSDKEKTTPVVYINDEVARVYQHSARAEEEFGRLPLTGRYCIGLARYAQSPLNEYAALGADLAAMTIDESQHLVSKEKLLIALERALVNVVNNVGVDINRAVTDPYYQSLLPFVAGLGPRKAAVLVNRINLLGGTLANRTQLVTENILSLTVFLNASGFLRIPQESDYRRIKKKKKNANRDHADELPDPLDDTRIHPEDYDLARKMAMDALEIDEEDIEEGNPSQTIAALMADPDAATKLNVLNLDEFAVQLQETTLDKKRHTLNVIKAEILNPFGEQRKEFQLPDVWDVVTMLTGETPDTLRQGRIVSVSVLRVKPAFVAVKLDSGIEGIINVTYLTNQGDMPTDQVVQKGQSIPAVIIHAYIDKFQVELSARPMDVENGDAPLRRIPTDEYYDQAANMKAKDLQDRKKRREVDRARRVIKHPNFHIFNHKEAEAYLANQQRGDVVIRPSTKGPEHIAVTWKVDDGVYQHIDVVDPNADISSTNVGSNLIVEGGKYHFSDLDELIVNHIKAMSRKVEELMAHEKFQKGTEDEIHEYLQNAVKAQRTVRSVYAFGLNRQRPGYFTLSFKTNADAAIQNLPVKVIPQGYALGPAIERGSVSDLCDSFKKMLSGKPGDSNRTPYTNIAGGRTPAQTPGRATPGHISSRNTPGHPTSSRQPNPLGVGKTPNPYGLGKTPNPYAKPTNPGGAAGGPYGGGATPSWSGGPPGGRPGAQVPAGGGGGWGTPSTAATTSWGAPPPTAAAGGWGSATPVQAGGGWGQPPAPPPAGGGWGGPPPPPPAGGLPAGMNPARAAMIQAANNAPGGAGGGGGGWGGGSSRGSGR